MPEPRKKPIKLEWQGGIADVSQSNSTSTNTLSERVIPKNEARNSYKNASGKNNGAHANSNANTTPNSNANTTPNSNANTTPNSNANTTPNTTPNSNSKNASTAAIKSIKLKKETKGRSGHPVIVLFDFIPSLSEETLETFSKTLKSKLGCGGSIENGTLILQTRSVETVETHLATLGILSKRCGGF